MAGYVVAHIVANAFGKVDSVWSCYDSAAARCKALNADPVTVYEYDVETFALNLPAATRIDMEAEREHRPST